MIKRKNIALYAFTFLTTLLFGYSNVFGLNANDHFTHHDGVRNYSKNVVTADEFYYYCYGSTDGALDGNCRRLTRDIALHHLTVNGSGEYVRAYCMDPKRHAPNNSDYVNDYAVKYELKTSNPIHRAIMYILSADVSTLQNNRINKDEGADYLIKSSAIRALIPLSDEFFVLNDLTDYDDNAVDSYGNFYYAYAYALINSGLYWATDEQLSKDEINKVFGGVCSNNNCDTDGNGTITPKELYEQTAITMIDDAQNKNYRSKYVRFHYAQNRANINKSTRIYDSTDNPMGAAIKELFIDAIKHAAKTSENDYSTKNVTVTKPLKLISDPKQSNNIETVSADFEVQLTFEGFASSDIKDEEVLVKISSNNFLFDVSNLKYSVGVSTENAEWKEFPKNGDFKDVIDSDSVSINIRGTISALNTITEEIKVTLNVKPIYNDKVIPTAYYVVNTESPDSLQRFFVYNQDEVDSNKVNSEIPFEVTIIPPSGSICKSEPGNNDEDSDEFKEWIEQCCYPSEEDFNVIDACEEATNNGNEEDKAKYCGYKEKYCSLCNTDIEVPQTCVEFDADGTFEGNIDGADMNATIDGPDALSICTKDSAGNSRETSETKGNRYCSVQCKEDYDISLPRGKYVTSGRYFELALKMTGTKTCSTDSIDFEEFRQDHDRLYNIIKSGNTDKKIIDEYNDIVSDIKECTNFNVDYSMNPEISYTYDEEEYIEKFGQDDFKFINVQELEGASSEKYCTGFDIDAKGDKLTGCHENAGLIGIAGLDCSSGSCKDTTLNLNKTKYVVKSVQKAALYAPKTEFYSKYITGEIKTNVTSGVANYSRVAKKVHTDLLGKDVIADVNSVPISLKTNMGIYNYNFKFSNLGEFYDQTKDGRLVLGRILGGKGSVALTDGETEFKGTYLCHYIVNCPECYSICVEDKDKGYTCTLPTKEQCPECYSHGTTVFDSNLGLLASAHNVSLINPFNGRTAGANWNAETNVKAKTALDEITTNGENIYSEPEYSFTFTPAVISYLKGENAKANGDYLNDTMTCKNYSDRYKGTDKYQEALEHDYKVCTSDILRKLKDFDVEVQIDSEEKFTSWLDSDYCKENVCAIVGEPFGPAWK